MFFTHVQILVNQDFLLSSEMGKIMTVTLHSCLFCRLGKEGARQELEDMVDCIKKHFFQPDKFGLKPRTES